MGETVIRSEIEVVKKKSVVGTFGKIIGMVVGICGIIFGALLCLTIIGFFIGFPIMFMSLGVIAGSRGFQQVKCPSCGKRDYVLKTAENFDCAKCRQFTVINWK